MPLSLLPVANPANITLTTLELTPTETGVEIRGSASNEGGGPRNGVTVTVLEGQRVGPATSGSSFSVGSVPASDFSAFDVDAAVRRNETVTIPLRVTFVDDGVEVQRTVGLSYRPPSGPSEPRTAAGAYRCSPSPWSWWSCWRSSAGGNFGASAMAGISIVDALKEYTRGENTVRALKGVSIDVDPGEFVAIVGPRGSGKPTLLNRLGLLDDPTSGSVFVDGVDAEDFSDRERRRTRRDTIGFVLQDFSLLPTLTARENLAVRLSSTAPAAGPSGGRATYSGVSGSATASTTITTNCPVARSSASPSPARSSTSQRWSSPTNPPATSTRTPVGRSSTSSATSPTRTSRW